MPWEELDASRTVKVMESSVTALTFHTRYDQLFVPLCRVFVPSLICVSYVVLSIVYLPFPMRFT